MTEDAIIFNAGEGSKEILKLTEEGMFYKGEFVEDVGVAYKRFIDWLDSTDQFVPEEVIELDLDEKETE